MCIFWFTHERFTKRFNVKIVLVYKTVLKLTPLMEILEKIRNDSTGKERKTVLKAILLCFFFVKPKTEAEK